MQNKINLYTRAARLLALFALIGAVFGIPIAAAEIISESTPEYSFSTDLTFQGSLGTEYDASWVVVDTQSFITVSFPQDGPISYETAGTAAYYMLKYAQHDPRYQEFIENWNLGELTDEIFARMNSPYMTDSVTISSEQSDKEEIVYGTFPNPIEFFYDDEGKVKYFISSDNNPDGSVVLQDWNSEYLKTREGYNQARLDANDYGNRHNTPISDERTVAEENREIRVHNRLYDWTKDPESTFYSLLELAGKNPIAIEFRTGEMNIDKQPETFPGSSWVPSEWQEKLGLTSKEFQVACDILEEVD